MLNQIDLLPFQARERLIAILQRAYSGELAAAHAYRGHWQSVACAQEQADIQGIEAEELEHRRAVGHILRQLDAQPQWFREIYMDRIGRSIAFLCHLGGWFIPMYGAGQLEYGNVAEYEHAARYAWSAELPQHVDVLLEMAEVEWEHEQYFRQKIKGHWLCRFVPDWGQLPPKDHIRQSFDDFCQQQTGLLASHSNNA